MCQGCCEDSIRSAKFACLCDVSRPAVLQLHLDEVDKVLAAAGLLRRAAADRGEQARHAEAAELLELSRGLLVLDRRMLHG